MGGDVLSRLDILLSCNSAQYRQEMNQTADESVSNFDRIRSGAKGMAAGIAAAFTVDAVVGFINTQIDAAIQLDNTAKAVGSNAQELQKWQLIAGKAGVEVDAVADSMSTLNEKLLDVATGGEDAAAFFTGLGISVTDAKGQLKSSAEVMLEMSDAFAQMTDGAAKSALASELMGDAGMALIPILNQGSDALENQMKKAEELGLVLDQETIKSMRQFKADTAATTAALDATKTSVAVQLMPTLAKLSGMLSELARESDSVKIAVAGVDVIFKVVASVAATVGGIFSVVGRTIGKLGAAIWQFISMDFRGAWQTISDGGIPFFAELQQVGNELGATLENIWKGVDKSATQASDTMKGARDAAIIAKIAAENADKPKKEKEKKAGVDRDNFDYAGASLAAQFETWSSEMAATERAYQTQVYLDLKAQAESYFALVSAGKSGLTTELIAIDQAKAQSVRESIAQQSALERLIFAQDNAQKIADAESEDARNRELGSRRLQMLSEELEQKRLMLDAAAAADLISTESAIAQKLQLQADFAARVAAIEADTTAQKRQQWQTAQAFFGNALDQMAQGQGKAAKVAKEINKARALWQIAQDTRSAAMGAYSALAGIPIIGPALGIAAAGAAIVFGGVQAKAVMSDAPAGGGSAGGVSIPSVAPVSSQQPQQPEVKQRTTYQFPADSIMTGRQVVDFMNQARSDGADFGSTAFSAI